MVIKHSDISRGYKVYKVELHVCYNQQSSRKLQFLGRNRIRLRLQKEEGKDGILGPRPVWYLSYVGYCVTLLQVFSKKPHVPIILCGSCPEYA